MTRSSKGVARWAAARHQSPPQLEPHEAARSGRLHARAQGSSCGGDWQRAAACWAASSCQARLMMTDYAQLEGCCAARTSMPSVFAAAGALRARVEPAGPGCFVRLQLWRRLTACCCPTRHTLRAARHRSPSTTPDKSLGRNTQQHAASVRRSWSLARARGAGRPVGRRRLTGTSRSCQCRAHAPVMQLLQMVYLGAHSRHMKAELLRYSRT